MEEPSILEKQWLMMEDIGLNSTTQEQNFKFVNERTGFFRSEKILNVKIKVGK
jgi:hypothetical protein